MAKAEKLDEEDRFVSRRAPVVWVWGPNAERLGLWKQALVDAGLEVVVRPGPAALMPGPGEKRPDLLLVEERNGNDRMLSLRRHPALRTVPLILACEQPPTDRYRGRARFVGPDTQPSDIAAYARFLVETPD